MLRGLGLTVLAALVASLGWLDWQLFAHPSDMIEGTGASPVAAWQPTLNQDKAPEFRPATIGDYAQTVERPVFSASRRPPKPRPPEPPPPAAPPQAVAEEPAPVPTAPPPAPSTDQIRLIGVMINANSRQALVRSPAAPEGKWYAENAEFDGWKLLEIYDGGIVVQSGGAKKDLKLFFDAPAPLPQVDGNR